MGVRSWRLLIAIAAATLVIAPAAKAGVIIGNWYVTEHDDGASGIHPTALLASQDNQSLVVSCDATGLDIFVSYVDVLTPRSEIAVRWRTETGPVHSETWSVGWDHSTMSSTPPQAARAFLSRIAKARSLTIMAGGHRSVFVLEGIRQVSNLIGTCPAH